MLTSVLLAGIAVFGCAIFFHAGYSKCRHSAGYVDIMAAYLGRPVTNRAVSATGFMEMVLALMLIVPTTRALGALGCSLLLVLYALFMWRQIQTGRSDLRCGCSGPAAETRVGPELVWRNALVAAGLMGVVAVEPPVTSWAVIFLTLVFGLFLVLVYLSVDQIIANRQRLVGWSV
jgi:uncharacterized membrane protein